MTSHRYDRWASIRPRRLGRRLERAAPHRARRRDTHAIAPAEAHSELPRKTFEDSADRRAMIARDAHHSLVAAADKMRPGYHLTRGVADIVADTS